MDYLAKQAGGLSDAQFNEDPTQSFRNRNWFKVDWNVAALHLDIEFNKNTVLNWRNFAVSSSRDALGFLGKITELDLDEERNLIKGQFRNAGSELRLLSKYKIKESRAAVLVGSRYYRGTTTSEQGNASNAEDADFRFLRPGNLDNSSYTFPI